MFKLTWQQRLRLWLWQQRRLLLLTCGSLLAVVLTVLANLWLLNTATLPSAVVAMLSLTQLGIAALLVLLLLIVTD